MAPATTAPAASSTAAAPPGTTSTGCTLAVTRTGADTFTFTYTSDLGAGATIDFTGSGTGRQVTNDSGTAVFSFSPGYAPTTAPKEVEHEAAQGPCDAATVSYVLPGAPDG